MVNKTPDLRFYKKTADFSVNKSELNDDLIITDFATLINPKVIFKDVEKPFDLINDNAVPSISQATELRELFNKSDLKLRLNRFYTLQPENNKFRVSLFERR